MKERFKSISFPTLLLLIVSVMGIKNILFGIMNIFKGYISIGSLVGLVESICPFVFFYFTFMQIEKKKSLGIVAVVFGCVTIVSSILSVPTMFISYEFIEAVVGGPLYNVISSMLIGSLLLFLGLKFIKNQNVTKKYYFLCGLSMFLLAYASVLMTIADPFAILSKLPTFLYVLSLWYIPKLYIEQEYQKTRITSKKVTTIVCLVIAMYVLLGVAGGLSGSTSSSSHPDEPWKDLGVTEKEYMDIYNYYKYGTPIR